MVVIGPLPTRSAGLARLAAFLPHAGRRYAGSRGEDRGPGHYDNVSGLSVWLRHRLLTESEVLRAVLARHSASGADKFIEEVFRRGYFKGYLEAHPALWSDYRRAVQAQHQQLAREPALAERYERASQGRTGIDAFDAWIGQLRQTGYLHQQARQCLASIWLFTLQLPWQLGAELTYRHFLDADPASNTLSWRAVAGLHPRGKPFLAQATGIARLSAGRFAPEGLAQKASPVHEAAAPAAAALPVALARPPAGRFALLLTSEDLHPESLGLEAAQVIGIAGAVVEDGGSAQRQHWASAALDDALSRAAAHFKRPALRLTGLDGDAIAEWAERIGASQVLTACAPVGPVEEALADAGDWLAMRRLKLLQLRRDYDAQVWGCARGEFALLRAQIPAFIERLDLTSGRPAQAHLPL